MTLKQPTPTEIKAARKAAKLTQTEMSAMLHVGLKTVQNWEAPDTSKEHRKMPLGLWKLFLIELRGAKNNESKS